MDVLAHSGYVRRPAALAFLACAGSLAIGCGGGSKGSVGGATGGSTSVTTGAGGNGGGDDAATGGDDAAADAGAAPDVPAGPFIIIQEDATGFDGIDGKI